MARFLFFWVSLLLKDNFAKCRQSLYKFLREVDSSLLAVSDPYIYVIFLFSYIIVFCISLSFAILKFSRRSRFGFCRGDFGRLGHGNSSDLLIPQPIVALQGLRIKQIACGDSHCLAVTMEGEVQRFVFLDQNFSILSVLTVFLCIY